MYNPSVRFPRRELRELRARFPNGLRAVDPEVTISVLQAAMTRAGYTEREAAAAILGSATANARAHIGQTDLAELSAGDE